MNDLVSQVVSAPTVAPISRTRAVAHERRSRELRPGIVAGEFNMGRLLKAMKRASGLPTRVLADRMGIRKDSLSQYFWQRRGKGGSSQLAWFLRFAEACGCRLWLTFPSSAEQLELKAKYPTPPVGNPNWSKRANPLG